MADYSPEVVKAVIARLKNTSEVSALCGAIYTRVPQQQELPYIRVGCQSEPFAADDFSGQRHLVRIQAFASKSGVALEIRAACHNALDRQEANISLEAGNLVKCEYAGLSDLFEEDDGQTWQAIAEFELLTM